jgi:hypothetical protein
MTHQFHRVESLKEIFTGTSHPTIKSPEQGLSVLARFANDFRYPSPHEGYDRLIELRPLDHPSSIYTPADIAVILQRLQNSTPIIPSAAPARSSWARGSSSFQGNRTHGGNNAQLNGVPQACASPHPINPLERGSFLDDSQSVAAVGFDQVRSTAGRSNNYQRKRRSNRGGNSDSPN